MLLCLVVCLAAQSGALSVPLCHADNSPHLSLHRPGRIGAALFLSVGGYVRAGATQPMVGLLNIPAGILAMFGAPLGGWFVENLSWRYIFWCGAPLLILCLVMTLIACPNRLNDRCRGSTAGAPCWPRRHLRPLILAFSLAGDNIFLGSVQVIGLLAASLVLWVLFIKAEAGAAEPILDLEVLKNRTVITIISACILSCFGMIGMMTYYPS